MFAGLFGSDPKAQSLDACNAFAQQKLDEMLQVCTFTRKLAELEQAHAAAITKLLEKQPQLSEHTKLFENLMENKGRSPAPRSAETIPLSGLWGCVLQDVRLRAKKQDRLSKRLSAEVVAPLSKLHGELDSLRREVMAEGQLQVRRLHDQHSALKVIMDQQVQARKATEDATSKVSKAQNTPWRRERELRKAKERLEKAQATQAELGRSLEAKEALCGEMGREV